MNISDFALFRVTVGRYAPWPLKLVGLILNYAFVLLGLAVAFGAGSFGVAAGWWLFERVS